MHKEKETSKKFSVEFRGSPTYASGIIYKYTYTDRQIYAASFNFLIKYSLFVIFNETFIKEGFPLKYTIFMRVCVYVNNYTHTYI